MLAFHAAHLKPEAEKALAQLGALVKETRTPSFMLEAMQDITYLKCVLTLYRMYLEGWEPAELKAQYQKTARLEAQLRGEKPR